MSLISDVFPERGYRLIVRLANGNSVVVDLSKKLNTCRFCTLTDENVFSDVRTDGIFVYWGNGNTKLSASEIYSTYINQMAV